MITEDDFIEYYFPTQKQKNIPQEIVDEETANNFPVIEEIVPPPSAIIPATVPDNRASILINDIEKKLAELKDLLHYSNSQIKRSDDKIINGRFNGEKMIGDDGKQYSVPSNYASKSKIVEGESLLLTIRPDGSYVYRRVSPPVCKNVVARIEIDENGFCYGSVQNKRWRLIKASVVYHKGEAGDKVVLLVPRDYEVNWAAIEGVIK